ncbi:diaminopimelate decarboxylase [Capsaspora owczarzaki ATCC 30864]|uniref:Diaminopimelate decarboxylase n=1 Tax=Capsaspora owczarzaki (strain ATCC 30864) TaxID=595528 RepID=A0A0D2WTY3_CAPO3|nr:diaminopimelate decarboxylase [Capsaspora owczarzaki ATCC 30864]KJE96025.1 diaminopimelate decarboxylase [Capsaspora owczarzaki ATCC 30864]|eukprot:XP_004345148.1 diaminopimelate decarboxylase [Capsaspora owczarzaki ATCC 30864]
MSDHTTTEEALLRRKAAATQVAIAQGLLGESDPVALMLDLDHVRGAIDSVRAAFDADSTTDFCHCLAIKSNPTLRVLQYVVQQGMGLEAASLGELVQAIRAGAPAENIVFDSPVKTTEEIRFALKQGVTINLDNMPELDRVAAIAAASGDAASRYRVGLRINPQGASGSLEAFSTGTMTSKFGIGLVDARQEIIAAYKRYSWLNAIHIHVGSQGIPMDLMASGVRRMLDLVKDIHAAVGKQQITLIDIGGGMSVNFSSEEITPTFAELSETLQQAAPELFSGEYRVFTEFGRSIVAKAGFYASRLEYVKTTGGRQIALQHIGADMAIRTIYHPDKWPLRVTLLTSEGALRPVESSEALVETDIAGPCCFAGDIIAHRRPFPQLHSGEYILVHDVGGYYHSSYSKYNLRQAPAVYGFTAATPPVTLEVEHRSTTYEEFQFTLLQARETVEDTLRMFTPSD